MDDSELQRLVAEAENVDLFNLRVIPDGADKPLMITAEADYTLTPADVRRSIRLWNKIMPRYWRGALEAKLATPQTTRRR